MRALSEQARVVRLPLHMIQQINAINHAEQHFIQLWGRMPEAEELSDIQPQDMNDDEILPDPAVYDTVRFIVKDLEAEGKVDCPCHEGTYELRFCDEGIQVYCEKCGATYTFHASSPSVTEEYLSLDSITLR